MDRVTPASILLVGTGKYTGLFLFMYCKEEVGLLIQFISLFDHRCVLIEFIHHQEQESLCLPGFIAHYAMFHIIAFYIS